MERLTDAICQMVSIAEEQLERKYFEELDNAGAEIIDCLEKLKHYEDLEEQGLLLRLPCKVGDVVYQITRDIVSEFRIKTFVCDNKTFFFHWECIKGIYKNVVGFHSSRIGVDVFLTKEEAEKALTEMEEKDERTEYY